VRTVTTIWHALSIAAFILFDDYTVCLSGTRPSIALSTFLTSISSSVDALRPRVSHILNDRGFFV
jgi:hypothetical protein